MNNNTVSNYPTHFLKAVELIENARKEYQVPSENWTYPTRHRFGIPNDGYYAEIFSDGMDWQSSYWIVEEYQCNRPVVEPLLIFESSKEEDKFNSYDFDCLLKACMFYRRDKLFLKHDDLGVYTEIIWPFLKLVNENIKFKKMKLFSMCHASQNEVKFWLNIDYVPQCIFERIEHESNRCNWIKTQGQPGGIQKGY